MRNLVLLFVLFFAASNILFASASTANAQGWRLFSKQIKEEAQKEKEKEKGKSSNEDGSSDSASGTKSPFFPFPPLFDTTRKNRERQAQDAPEKSADELNAENSEQEEEKVERDVRSPVSNGGLLDFSDALGSDGAELTGDADNAPPTYEETFFQASPPSYRNLRAQQNDARLNDLCFIDASRGWVVGDRGVILRTEDGGQNWRFCAAPTDDNLFGVSFLDENYGLAVGGRVLPGARIGLGVVLRTVDGGETWTQIETAAFPILRDVRILDEENAWIAGDSSNLYPSGLFFSSDTGLEWIALEGNKRGGWRSALYDPIERLGLGVTTSGGVQRVDGVEASRAEISLGSRRAFDVAYDGSTGQAWVVGDRGLALVSSDFGASWSLAPGGFPNDAQNYFDLNSVCAVDGLVGAVGSPGSLFFYTTDGGAHWDASRTSVSTPLRKVAFANRERGWAVGDLGVILSTTDGGATWTKQRSGGSRVAALGIFGRTEDVPFEALVQLAGDEGFLTEISLVARELDREGLSDEITPLERFNEALVETGASGCDVASLFTLNPSVQRDSVEQILQRFDAENDGDGLARFRERLVRLLRMWRPSCLMTVDSTLDDGASEVGTFSEKFDLQSSAGAKELVGTLSEDSRRLNALPKDPFQELLLRELPAAIKNAADPTAYPEHLTSCALDPWNVQKARSLCRGKTQGNMTIDSSFFCPALGRPVGEIAANARAILADSSTVKSTTSFQTLFSAAPPRHSDRTFFDGLNIPYGSAARRSQPTELSRYAESLSARAGSRRQKLGIVETLARGGSDTNRRVDLLLSQLRGNIQDTDADFAVEYLLTIGRQFAALGNLTAAAEAFSLIVQELPNLARSREAFVWLAQYYSGGEPALRVRKQGGETLDQAVNARLMSAKSLGDTIRQFAPETYMASEVRFPLAVAQIRRGEVAAATNFYMTRSLSSSDDVWGARAAAEYWLLAPEDRRSGPSAYCPLGSFSCRRFLEKPYLDGELEPKVWDAAQSVDLSTPIQEAPPTRELTVNEKNAKTWRAKNRALSTNIGTNASFARDNEYLYIGLNCRKAPEFNYVPSESGSGSAVDASVQDVSDASSGESLPSRGRDVNLDLNDRIEVLIDLDGDYTTAYKFVFDYRGWVCDSNWGDSTWNPGLYVASSQTSDAWTVEAAIPLVELTPRAPTSGEVWRVAVRRVTPGVGVECWNVENSESGENAYGFMIFDN